MSIENALIFIAELSAAEPEKFQELLLEDASAVQKFAQERGVEFSLEDIEAAGASLRAGFERSLEQELDEEALESVAGGITSNMGKSITILPYPLPKDQKDYNLSLGKIPPGTIIKDLFKAW